MNKIFGVAVVGVSLFTAVACNALGTATDSDQTSPDQSPAKRAAIAKALSLGLKASNEPVSPSPYSPFLRIVRHSKFPIDVHTCQKIEVISGAGVLKMNGTTPFEANPYSYMGMQMTLNERTEYVEAGIGYDSKNTALGPLFRPYMRRDPDTEDIDGTRPPDGWELRTRNNIPLPGFWSASESRPDKLAAPNATVCMNFSFDWDRNVYVAEFEVRGNLQGGNYSQRLEMPSARKFYQAGASPILDWESRILTTVAITADSYDPKDPIYKDLVYGVSWQAEARDHALTVPFWEAFDARNVEWVNSDPSRDVIFYSLSPFSATTTAH